MQGDLLCIEDTNFLATDNNMVGVNPYFWPHKVVRVNNVGEAPSIDGCIC